MLSWDVETAWCVRDTPAHLENGYLDANKAGHGRKPVARTLFVKIKPPDGIFTKTKRKQKTRPTRAVSKHFFSEYSLIKNQNLPCPVPYLSYPEERDHNKR